MTKHHAEWLPSDVDELRSEIRYLEKHYARKAKQCNELTQKCAFYLDGVHYYREKMIEGNEKLQIYKRRG